MSLGTIILIILIIALLGGFSGISGGPFYGTGLLRRRRAWHCCRHFADTRTAQENLITVTRNTPEEAFFFFNRAYLAATSASGRSGHL
jgi:hypothetical protein